MSALRDRSDDGPSMISALLAARTVAEAIEDATRLLVSEARRVGHTWQEIGELLAISRQAAHQRFGASAGKPGPADAEPSLARRAVELVGQLGELDWEAVSADWDATMRAALPLPELAAVWDRVLSSAGELEAVGRPVITRRGPYRIVDVPLVFKHGPLKARITFNHDSSIAGLFILLPDAR